MSIWFSSLPKETFNLSKSHIIWKITLHFPFEIKIIGFFVFYSLCSHPLPSQVDVTSRQLILWEISTHNSVISATTFIKNGPNFAPPRLFQAPRLLKSRNQVVQLPPTPLFQLPYHSARFRFSHKSVKIKLLNAWTFYCFSLEALADARQSIQKRIANKQWTYCSSFMSKTWFYSLAPLFWFLCFLIRNLIYFFSSFYCCNWPKNSHLHAYFRHHAN